MSYDHQFWKPDQQTLDALASHPMKAWYNGDGNYWLANSGDKADVQGWDYYPFHMENGYLLTTNTTKGR